jgi:hypothetical protein
VGCLHLGVDVGCSSLVACLGLFSGLEYSGHQMLGSSGHGLLDPEHKRMRRWVYAHLGVVKVPTRR